MKTIRELREEHDKNYAETRSKLEEHEIIFDSALRALSKLNVVSVYFTGTLDISITGDKHALTAGFGALRRLGFEPTTRPKSGEPQYHTFFTHESGAQIWFAFSSTQCRRVKTGTKTVEQDVYETVCDEMQLPDEITARQAEVVEELLF